MKRIVLLLLVLSFNCWGARAPLVFLSDFGELDDAVAICKGVMLKLYPDATVVDLTHNVTPYQIEEGARFLSGAAEYYPEGTVFMTVVDPGVGSTRRPMVARSRKGQFFVLPDNGLITLVADRDGLEEARVIANPEWILQSQTSSTFHGRDIFSPVSARLARGDNWHEVGPVLKDWVRLNITLPKVTGAGIEGQIQGVDGPYGNLITNIRMSELEKAGLKMGDTLTAALGKKTVTFPLKKTFSDVPVGKPLFYLDSKGFVALAVNQGNFQKKYQLSPPHPITLQKAKGKS